MVVIGIVALLIALVAPISGVFVERAKKAKCISNMRSIHSGLMAYTVDIGHWPQMEEDKFDFKEEELFEFWINATEPYGVGQESWVCPSDRAIERRRNEDDIKYFGSYLVTRFDDKAQTPFRWNQPWAMERAGFHGGRGVHMLMPDGSVSESHNPFAGR